MILFFTLELFQKCYVRHQFLADSGDRARFAQMGIAGVITKPFELTSICEEVTHILGWDD
ncbi:hypothetical protein [Nostoc sp.]